MDGHGLNLNLHLHPMGTDHQDHTGAYDQGQIDRHGLNLNLHLHPMGTDHQDNTGAYDPRLLTDWNQEKMGALNPYPVGTYHQGQTDFHHQSEIDSCHPSYMNSPYATNIDDLTGVSQFLKPLKTRGKQLLRRDRLHDVPHTARTDRTVCQNPDVQEQPFLDTFRLNKKKSSRNPHTQREHPEK